MRLNQSQIFKQNLQITFTYKDNYSNRLQKDKALFQSTIFPDKNIIRQPLLNVYKFGKQNQTERSNRVLAESMMQQNRFQTMNINKFYDCNSVGQQKYTQKNKINKLIFKQIEEQIIQTRLQDFQIGQLLGKGATANVYVCRHKQTGFFFALKKIKKKSIIDKNQFIQSIKIHMFLNQPNIVKLYTVFNDQDHIYMLMQLCMDGNLKSQTKNIKSLKQRKSYILGIAYGLRHLHKRGIRHGDVKLQNVMCSYGMPKIVDFDCILLTNKNNSQNSKKNEKTLWGSPLYFSPQMMKQSTLGLHDDVWSLGIISYQITCGIYPFSVDNVQNLSKIIHEEMKKFPEGTDSNLQFLIRTMLAKRLCQRPKLSLIIKQLEKI